MTCFRVMLSNSISFFNQTAASVIMITIRAGLQIMATVIGAGDTFMKPPHRKTQEEIGNNERNKKDIPNVSFSVKVFQ
ncbi:MAG: hypothetical protein B6D35_09750 [Candidatus Brocadia sp. UTAMX2]|nr:MAG: hypothetical protein B6D35_09750 [Candidatus Brocadia sp. UTAMX2]